MKSKERRQVEIVDLVQQSREQLSVEDLHELFKCGKATINRDLEDLRSLGISIHSVKKVVRLTKTPGDPEIRMLLSRYLASAGDSIGYPKNISLVVRKLKSKTLRTFIQLVKAIEKSQVLEIKYFKISDGTIVFRVVEPYEIVPTTRDWRLIARTDRVFKQFVVENIREIRDLDRNFTRLKDFTLEDLFKHSFEYWTVGELLDVELRFTKSVTAVVENGIWGGEQEMERQDDGSLILKLKVNSVEQIGNWVLTWGGSVRVLKPVRLRNYVLNKAEGLIKGNRI